jgi:hypothetical protein
LSYPAPIPSRRHFHPLVGIPQTPKKVGLFDAIFSHPIMRKQFKKFSGHGTFPIILGAAATATGHSQMLVRSIAVVVCAIWLSLDVGIWISEANWREQVKAIVFCASTWILCCLAMGIMYWFLLSTLEDQRTDVSQHLVPRHEVPPGEDDPMHTMFSITNGGSFDISRKHQITCFTRLALSSNGTGVVSGMWSGVVDGHLTLSGSELVHTSSDYVLRAGGDAVTEPCLQFFRFENGTSCVDMDLIFWYSLDTQPNYEEEKKFRYVAYKGKNGEFMWYGEPVESSERYCKRFYKGKGDLP